MKPSLGALLFCASMVIAVQARATILPDACGDDKIKFDVKTEKSKTRHSLLEQARRRSSLSKTKTR